MAAPQMYQPTDPVSEWMTPDPVTVSPDAILFEVQALFRRHRCRHVPVVGEDGRPVGIVSDRDVLEVVSPFVDTASEAERDKRTIERPVRELMTPAPHTAAASTPLAEAAERMVTDVISSLLVIDEAGRLVGILTARDVLRASAGLLRASPEAG